MSLRWKMKGNAARIFTNRRDWLPNRFGASGLAEWNLHDHGQAQGRVLVGGTSQRRREPSRVDCRYGAAFGEEVLGGLDHAFGRANVQRSAGQGLKLGRVFDNLSWGNQGETLANMKEGCHRHWAKGSSVYNIVLWGFVLAPSWSIESFLIIFFS